MISGDGFNSEHVFALIRQTLFSPAFIAVVFSVQHVMGWNGTYWYGGSLIYFFLLAGISMSQYHARKKKGPIDWFEEIAVVTGGSSGVGWTLAQSLGMKGADVIILDVNAPQDESRNVTSMICDVSDEKAVQAATKEIIKKYGAPTILVNNAGIVRASSILDVDPAAIRRETEVNYLSNIWLTQAILPGMIKANHGSIISVSSVLGLSGVAGGLGYCASKSSVFRFQESLVGELISNHPEATNVYASAIAPAFINTNMFSSVKSLPSIIFRFIPKAETIEIAHEIIDIIDGKCSTVRYTPALGFSGILSQFFPSGFKAYGQSLVGASDAFRAMAPARKAE